MLIPIGVLAEDHPYLAIPEFFDLPPEGELIDPLDLGEVTGRYVGEESGPVEEIALALGELADGLDLAKLGFVRFSLRHSGNGLS